MHRPAAQPALAELRQCWSEWTRIVRLFVLRRASRWQIPAEAFEKLRGTLLASCRQLADESSGPEQAFYQSLQGVVSPWLTLTALERADGEILSCLLAWCLSAQRQLCGGRDPEAQRQRLRRVVGGAAATFGAALAGWLFIRFGSDVSEWLGDRGRELWLAVRQSSARQRWLAGGLVLVLAAMWLVSWRQRRA